MKFIVVHVSTQGGEEYASVSIHCFNYIPQILEIPDEQRWVEELHILKSLVK